jgi:hypothetical protein
MGGQGVFILFVSPTDAQRKTVSDVKSELTSRLKSAVDCLMWLTKSDSANAALAKLSKAFESVRYAQVLEMNGNRAYRVSAFTSTGSAPLGPSGAQTITLNTFGGFFNTNAPMIGSQAQWRRETLLHEVAHYFKADHFLEELGQGDQSYNHRLLEARCGNVIN